MISQKEMLDIILTEALETVERKEIKEKDEPSIEYNLRLVRNSDGSLEWVDD